MHCAPKWSLVSRTRQGAELPSPPPQIGPYTPSISPAREVCLGPTPFFSTRACPTLPTSFKTQPNPHLPAAAFPSPKPQPYSTPKKKTLRPPSPDFRSNKHQHHPLLGDTDQKLRAHNGLSPTTRKLQLEDFQGKTRDRFFAHV